MPSISTRETYEIMTIQDLLFGKALRTMDEGDEQVGVGAGIPVFGLDALSSAAYGPEAALTLLIALGAVGVAYIVPITTSILILLLIVYFSYRQTIDAYPGGGGSYTVASENLGPFAGLLAAAALMIDYILTVAVGISAGVGALISAVPSLLPHTLGLCLLILIVITFINLRGLRSAGILFMVPTYLFLASILGAIVWGLIKTVAAGGHPAAVVAPPPPLPATLSVAGTWLLLQAFASGCTAMTGVEAVSNGVKAFREPCSNTAKRTLTIIIALLMLMLGGIAYLVRAYNIAATDPGASGYQSVLSMLVAAVAGRGTFYYVAIGSVLAVLALSANTAFADFPRLCRAIAMNGYLPDSFVLRGRRLVYTRGIYFLFIFSAILLILFRGVTNRLIPLYAVGAFLAFTLSQAGMVAHWRRVKGPRSGRYMFVNGLGAVATGITVLVVVVAKFVEGAWITVLLIPALVLFMKGVRRYFDRVEKEVEHPGPLDISDPHVPIVVLPVQQWGRVAQKALRVALTLSNEIEAVHVCLEGEKTDIHERWVEYVEEPAKKAGFPVAKLVMLTSQYRQVLAPIVDYVLETQLKNPHRRIAVVIPEMVERHWYHFFLQNQRPEILKALLLLKGNERIVIVNVPWYLHV
jgi:amino acid transporter